MDKMNIYKIRENINLYQYLKYNSYLYKDIIRGTLNIKELNKKMKADLNQTPVDKLKEMNNKIELINTFINIIK